ncbi:MAG TPA: hypothetical protein VHS56_01510 [Candidatus Cybelea sp.]|nr:hypothetical protein [Candidatus Cybelea sp.]
MIALGRYIPVLCATSALLAGCSGSQTTLPAPAGPFAAQGLARGTGEVQYFSNAYNGTLLEFDYPRSESSIGSISFSGGGLCTKGAGTFWVAASDAIAEFKVGGATPIRMLKASGASNCAIDSTTGDLAALTSGGVTIFHKARGKGKLIVSSGGEYFDGYDSTSNLFVDGFSQSGAFGLVELKKGGSAFETITTSNAVEFPGSVQWDGKYLTITDQLADAIYRYTVSGTKAMLKGTVLLSGATDCVQTWIARPYVYCADAGNDDGEVFEYPAGGKAVAILDGSFDLPFGVVSLRAR